MQQYLGVGETFNFQEIEVKGEKEFYVSGYISTKSLDKFNDTITDECLDDMLVQVKSGSIKIDFEHETIHNDNLDINPVARIIDAKKDEKGLWVKAVFNSAHKRFSEIKGSIMKGFLDSFSIAFKPIETATRYIQGKAVRILNKLKLINVGITGTPVNDECKLDSVFVKAIKEMDIEEKALDDMDETELKAKYIKRTGNSGNYKYFYRQNGPNKGKEEKTEKEIFVEPITSYYDSRTNQRRKVGPGDDKFRVVEKTESGFRVISTHLNEKEANQRVEKEKTEKEVSEWKKDMQSEGISGKYQEIYMEERRLGGSHQDAIDSVYDAQHEKPKEKEVNSSYGDAEYSNKEKAINSFNNMTDPQNRMLLSKEGRFITTTIKRSKDFKEAGWKEEGQGMPKSKGLNAIKTPFRESKKESSDEKPKEKVSFEDVLADEEGKKIVEAIEHIDEDTKDERLIKIRKDYVKQLKDKFGYEYKALNTSSPLVSGSQTSQSSEQSEDNRQKMEEDKPVEQAPVEEAKVEEPVVEATEPVAEAKEEVAEEVKEEVKTDSEVEAVKEELAEVKAQLVKITQQLAKPQIKALQDAQPITKQKNNVTPLGLIG